MLVNTYTLPQLIDLALKEPQIGIVNFNILHTVLQTIVLELNLESVQPWCNIENEFDVQTSSPISDSFSEEDVTKTKFDVKTARKMTDKMLEKIYKEYGKDEESDSESTNRKMKALMEEKYKSKTDTTTEDAELITREQLDCALDDTERQTEIISEVWKATNINRRMNAVEEAVKQFAFMMDLILNRLDQLDNVVDHESKKIQTILPDLIEIPPDEKPIKAEDIIKKIKIEMLPAENLLDEDINIEEEEEDIKIVPKIVEEVIETDAENLIAEENAKKENIKMLQNLVEENIKRTMESKLDLKVDKDYFFAAVSDLGEAIECLSDQLRKEAEKCNDMNDQFAYHIQKKLKDFEAIQTPLLNRVGSLMIGFNRLKNIIIGSIFPEAAGVTKCISCGRLAKLAGGIYIKSCKQTESKRKGFFKNKNGKFFDGDDDGKNKKRHYGEKNDYEDKSVLCKECREDQIDATLHQSKIPISGLKEMDCASNLTSELRNFNESVNLNQIRLNGHNYKTERMKESDKAIFKERSHKKEYKNTVSESMAFLTKTSSVPQQTKEQMMESNYMSIDKLHLENVQDFEAGIKLTNKSSCKSQHLEKIDESINNIYSKQNIETKFPYIQNLEFQRQLTPVLHRKFLDGTLRYRGDLASKEDLPVIADKRNRKTYPLL